MFSPTTFAVVKHSGHPSQSGPQLHLTLQRCLNSVQNPRQFSVGGLIVGIVIPAVEANELQRLDRLSFKIVILRKQ